MQLNSIEELIEDYKQGKMVILMDDEDRENEGDLLVPAVTCSAEDINFMAKYGRGLICLTMTKERCNQLHLPMMVVDNQDPHGTPFTVSIEAAKGVTTGISAGDRAVTVQAAVAKDATPQDIVTPGHIFPLMARPGGVLMRAGHTEAGCDLAKLAGLEPASVIVEIMNEDGSMARRDDLEDYAKQHDLKIGTIADLIEYKLQNEKTIERVSQCKLPTEFGEFTLIGYEDVIEHHAHFALTFGNISSDCATAVRVHMSDTMCDMFGSEREECKWSLRSAMQQVAKIGSGAVVVLRKNQEGADILDKIQSLQMADRGIITPETKAEDDAKTYGLGAQIISDLGLSKLKVIGSESKMIGLSGFGLEVTEYIKKEL